MKKSFFILLTGLLLLSLTSCSAKKSDNANNRKVKIVCTIFPEYDWAQNITGNEDDSTYVSLLLKNGVDLHSYQPSATDFITISSADIFMYVGGESDAWVSKALENANNPDMKVINLMEVLKNRIKEEEIIEGMQTEEAEEAEDSEEEIEYDEHVWLSLENARIICQYFTDVLCLVLPENDGLYKTNLQEYLKKIDAMDFSFRSVVENSQNKTLIFCDRFPFRYFTEDYGLKYYAAFAGCSSETEASFETVAFLSEKLKESSAPAVLVLENSDKKIARTVIGNAKEPTCDILTMDSMQSVTLRQAFAGVSYINIMQKNLETLQKVLK